MLKEVKYNYTECTKEIEKIFYVDSINFAQGLMKTIWKDGNLDHESSWKDNKRNGVCKYFWYEYHLNKLWIYKNDFEHGIKIELSYKD